MASNDGVNSNQLHRNVAAGMNEAGPLHSIGNLSNMNVAGRAPNAVPLSTSYLQQPMTSSYGSVPSLPVRRSAMSSYNRMGMGMGSYYSPYSRYPSSMYSPGYGGYRMSPYGGHYGSGPMEGSQYNSFIQMAEESTRPAFESIESVVEVVSSISMMLESTYHAVHSSYSAILGVVDQFSRLRDHLAQMLSILALLKGLRWLCLKVLYILKLRKENPSDEAAWSSAELLAGSSSLHPLPPRKAQGSAWPFLMFIGLVIGAPWLMFKLLSKSVSKKPLDLRIFKDEFGRHHVATAAFDFKATQRDELSFSAGEKLYLSPSSYNTGPKGWVYACNSKQQTGLVPQNYLASGKNAKTARSTTVRIPTEQAAVESIAGPSQPFDFLKNTDNTVNDLHPNQNSPQVSKDQSPVDGGAEG